MRKVWTGFGAIVDAGRRPARRQRPSAPLRPTRSGAGLCRPMSTIACFSRVDRLGP